jgi:HK97 family phage major capsid protein
VALQAGAQVLPNLTANVSIPRTATKQAAQWLAGEFDPLVASQPTLGQVSLTPKTCGALTTYTKLLEAINPQTEAFIASHLLRVIGTTVDAAILGGSGIAGQPQGIVGTAGVGSATVDSTYTWGDVTGMVQTVAENGSEPSAIVSTPAVRKLLQGRQRFTGGDSGVWSNAAIGDTRAYATTTCPTGKLIVGDFSQLVLAIWGSGVDISIDGYTDWATGKITMRLLLSVDTALLHPASFSVAAVS